METVGKTVLAVASRGGHWEQMMLLSPAFEGMNVCYATTDRELISEAGIERGYVVNDCNRNRPLQTLRCFFQCIKIIMTVRPDSVVSTGAAPGLLCLILGRLVGAQAIWVDSFANVEQLSMSGRFAKYVADVWVTQWQHCSGESGPVYAGALL